MILLTLPVVHAAESFAELSSVTEDDFFTELPVVLHATRLQQSIDETPVSMTVIDRQMIEASSATTIPELLRYVPGFQLSYRSGDEALTSYQGIADEYGRRVQVTIDGHAVYSQAFMGGILWSSLPITLDDIERIEVVRGPNAAAFGANALMGSINIVTLDPHEAAGSMVRLDYGSNGRAQAGVRHAGGNGDINYLVSAGYEENSGLPNRYDDLQAKRFHLRGTWAINTVDRIEFALGYRDAEEGTGITSPHERFVESSYQQLRWRHINAADDEIQLSFHHNRLVVDDLDNTGFFPLDKSFTSDQYDIELQHILRLRDNIRLVWGAGASYEKVDAPWFYDIWFFYPDEENSGTTWRVFSNAEWNITPALLLNAGLMYENTGRIDDFLSSRIGLNYRVNDKHSLRAGLSRSWRAPSFYENYSSFGYLWEPIFVSDPGSLKEGLDSIEIGYLGHFLDQKMALDIKFFYHDFTDRIILFDEFGPEFYSRLNEYEQAGFEMQLSYTGETDSLHLGYSYVKEIERDNSELVEAVALSSPEQTLSLLYSHRFANDWLGSISLFYVDDLRWNFSAASTVPVSWADLKLARKFKTTNGDLDVSLQLLS
ncbi:hypothetical protein BOW16_04680 [Solemya velum gill symbiont]|uniref:TonB-dependent receptor plug domain-containing protein n=1 Tax=Solemya velum gill symbiont TaxID=2340 RepID=UPI0009967B06|nr:TonB-dependent receptor [Solemya velum gill symbiont]OOY70309.1 hypothetical protein BOW07_04940 [Solemya velum gill symbiont]OOY79986.1 hypothetical protein BOW11_05600 [Solemya velum gill symbiont]OOY81860.1 hypothetical protein BOW12_08165 [Solemya velum gill symbiont]OOY90831.1 hypothetical protein BOW15_06635 [Solemya velum gill symbiont]OOY90938.1 hypothetical protein BOW16_04680 [Solemya velum gill symbiont]